MKAVRKLLALPVRRMPVGCILVLLLWLAGLAGMLLSGQAGLVFVAGVATWFWYMLAGVTLRSVMRPETLLLPGFRRHLAVAGIICALVTVLPPLAMMIALGGAGHALLAASLIVLAMVVGIATGLGMRITLVIWLLAIAAGWQPGLSAMVSHAVMASAWSPLLFILLAGLLLYHGLRPLLVIADKDVDESPLQAIADGRKLATNADGTPRHKGLIGKKLTPLLDHTAQRTLTAALTRFDARRSHGNRMAVIRAVLLPHDNPQAVALNLLVIVVIASLYFVLTDAAHRWQVGYLGAYAVIISLSRFAAVGRGMLQMRPNLADLYMTLAPDTHRTFQATLADALLWLVAVTSFNCMAYAVLVVLLLHDDQPAQLLLATGITGIAAAFSALGVHLIGPESKTGRMLVQFALMGGAAAAYALVYWLIGRFGLAAGAIIGLVLTLPFGIGGWREARKIYLQRRPVFDAPLD